MIKLNAGIMRTVSLAAGLMFTLAATAQDKKPNILVIWGDDVGIHN
ncbi:MAG: hypothetical protein ACI8ZW_001811, partial [Yoonia sp.]